MQIQLTPTERDRFWSHVDNSGGFFSCWPWRASLDSHGYGHVNLQGRLRLSHRVAWLLAHGPIPDGLWVLHRCDNPSCCNPAHLWLGSQLDNSADMRLKKRGAAPRGEKQHKAKLTAQQVREIRGRYASGAVTQAALAQEYGVRHSLIWAIVRGEIWRYID